MFSPINSLKNLLAQRQSEDLLRKLPEFHAFTPESIDFFSNDYLGFAQMSVCSEIIAQKYTALHAQSIENYAQKHLPTGATGSRLISGNVPEAMQAEKYISAFHNAESSLIFSTGYTANVGLLSCLATENDVYLSDQLIHASMIDGVKLSKAQKLRFRHNDMAHLMQHLKNIQKNRLENAETPQKTGFTYILVESLYSMDGDIAPLKEIYALAEHYEAYIIVDEAHALAVYGEKGKGFAHEYAQNPYTFARIYTFGKAMGTHGAVIVGSETLKSYLVNFARSFIYSTALPPAQYLHIEALYRCLEEDFFGNERQKLRENITFFKEKANDFLDFFKNKNINKEPNKEINQIPIVLPSDTAIQTLIIGGNTQTRAIETYLRGQNFLVKAIVSPTVPAGTERLRLCLHSFNTFGEISLLFEVLKVYFSR